ncbi:Cytosolic seryl-tRNA synthetase, partial [Nowakowskiella sp. JEL0078]
MLDINDLRVEKGGNPDKVRDSQRKRGASVELVDEILALDALWIVARFEADEKNKQINAINKQIQPLMKAKQKEQAAPLLAFKANLEKEKKEFDAKADDLDAERTKKLMLLGNYVHESVPDSLTEDDNVIIKTWFPEGRTEDEEREKKKKLIKADGKGVPGLSSHHEIMQRIDGSDMDRGAKIAGHRGYFLMGPGVELNLALVQYGLDFLAKRGFTKLWTPFFMKKELMAKTAQLEEFDEALYKIVQKEIVPGEQEPDGNSMYMIATSEQPISAFHSGEWFAEPEKELPKRYAGQSTCFRKEAGSAGRDNWGIFRVHQFEKVEQFSITTPDKSWEEHEFMLKNAEDFYSSLGIPYRVVAIVSGALNNAAAKKYDLEAWFPFQTEYKELVSCSNCLDYQSRRLDIRVGAKKLNDQVKNYVHCLNCTLVATERAMCCVLENYQTDEGVIVPEVLRPYMGGKEFIPFVKDLVGKKLAMTLTGPGKVGVGLATLTPKLFGTLYSYSDNPRIVKILIAAAYNNLKLDVQNLNVKKDIKTLDFLSKFPLGKLPVFEGRNGFTLFESNAITQYVADQSSGRLLGTSTKEKALINQFINFNENEFIPAEAVWLFPLFGWIPENPAFTKKAKLDVKKALNLLEAHLLTRTYLVGETITLADITVSISLVQFYTHVFDKVWRNEFKNVTRWFVTCVNQKEFVAFLGEVKLCEVELTIKKENKKVVEKLTTPTVTNKTASLQKIKTKTN